MLTTFAGATVDVSPRQLVRDEVSVLGSRYASRWEVSHAATLVAEGKIKPIVSETVPLGRVAELNAKLRAHTLLGRGALDLLHGGPDMAPKPPPFVAPRQSRGAPR